MNPAISVGTKPVSISLGSKKFVATSAPKRPTAGSKSAFSSSTNSTKRGAALSDDEDDVHYDDHRDKVQLVTGFGSKGAITEGDEKESKPLVIPSLKNKDWRAESRKKKGIYLPPEAAARQNGASVDTRETINDEPMKVGLQFVEKSTAGMTIAEVSSDTLMPDAGKRDGEGEVVEIDCDRFLQPQILRQRFQPFLAGDCGFGAALGTVGKIEIF